MVDGGILALAGLGVALGLRHGIDWDHIAAITDITSSAVPTAELAAPESATVDSLSRSRQSSGSEAAVALAVPQAPAGAPAGRDRRRLGVRRGMSLATMYALGHATLVMALGLLAIWLSAVLPEWLDPLMERLVGLTLLALGLWIVYSLWAYWRHGEEFRLQSRWMAFFALIGRGWDRLRAALTGRPVAHRHDLVAYGPGTAYGIGLLHGIGAETGSQAVLLAGAAGATTRLAGSLLLLFFTVGLLISNTLVAAFSAFGFVSSSAKRRLYVAVGIAAAAFSLAVGALFVAGRGAALPDLQELLNRLFGAIPGSEP